MLPGLAPSIPFNGDFPNIEDTSTYSSASNTTSHVVSLPSGIQIGELLVMHFVTNATGASHTTPSGWTLLKTIAATPRRLSTYYKRADGTEGSTVTVTADVSGAGMAIVDRVSRSQSNAEAGTAVTGLNPPSITPSWGAQNSLFMAGVMNASATTGDPANYGEGVEVSKAPTVFLRRVIRRINGSPEDPGAFSGTSSPAETSTTAIQPLT